MARPKKPIEQPDPPDASLVWDDSPLDDPAALDRLAGLLPAVRDREAFDKKVVHLAYWVSHTLAEQRRADEPAVRKALAELVNRVDAAQAAFDGLGYDARKAVESRASRRQPALRTSERLEGKVSVWSTLDDVLPANGAGRLQFALQMMQELRRRSAEARQALPKSKPHGRPPGDALHDAMDRLKTIWTDQTGTAPTYTEARDTTKDSPFITFADAILRPVCRAHRHPMPWLVDLARKPVKPEEPFKPDEPDDL